MSKKSIIPETIETAFYDRTKAGREHVEAGGIVCGYYNTGMPVEIALATGHMPMGIQPLPDRPTPLADEWLNETFNPQDALILDQLLSDELKFLRVVVAVSKAQADSWVYFCAKEILRQEVKNNTPPLHSYALLGMQDPVVKKYGRLEIEALERRLASNSLIEATDKSLRDAIATMNTIRAAWRNLTAARREGRVSGCDALKIMSASHFLPPERYIPAVKEALSNLPKSREGGPRLAVISSDGLGDLRLHQALEDGGATVVSENDWWGSASATPDIDPGDDPLQAIYEHYYEHVPNLAVVPASVRLRWVYETASSPDIDGFVIHMPRSDRALGWDYPRIRDHLNDSGKPHLMIREDSSDKKGAAAITKKVSAFAKSIQETVA